MTSPWLAVTPEPLTRAEVIAGQLRALADRLEAEDWRDERIVEALIGVVAQAVVDLHADRLGEA